MNGAKMWISNSPKSKRGGSMGKKLSGQKITVDVERGMAGFTTPETHGKWSFACEHHR